MDGSKKYPLWLSVFVVKFLSEPLAHKHRQYVFSCIDMLYGYLNQVFGLQIYAAGYGQVAFYHVFGYDDMVGISLFIQHNSLFFLPDSFFKVFQEPVPVAVELKL